MSEQEDDVDWAEILAQINEAQARRRGYAEYWDWPLDRKRGEIDVVERLTHHLATQEGFEIVRTALVAKDPPDVVLETKDGQRIGVEVTELVSNDVAAYHRHRIKTGEGDPYVHAIWTAESVAEKLRSIIQVKEAKVATSVEAYDQIILAIQTDEPMITVDLAQSAIRLCSVELSSLKRAFLLLGYISEGAGELFPEGYPVLEIPPAGLRG